MLADNRTTTLSWHIDRHSTDMLVDMSTNKRPIYWSICLPTYQSRGGLYINWDIGCVTVNILTNISVDMLTNTMYIDQGVQRSKKIRPFFKKCYWRSLLIKRVMLERYSILGDFFFRLKLLSIIFSMQSRLSKSCFLIGYLNGQDRPILSTQDFQCLSHKRKFSFWWEYTVFQMRWLEMVFLDHYTFLEE